MYWTNVCIEGHCFAETNDKGYATCGGNVPSPFCLGMGGMKSCPHFAWSDTTERDVAHFVHIHHIIKDKLGIWMADIWSIFCWWAWDGLWFNRRKVREFFNNIKVVTAEENPTIAEWEESADKHNQLASKKTCDNRNISSYIS